MRYLIAAVVAVILALPVAAEDFRKGLQAYERGDYGTAFRQWRPLAEQGDAIAQNNLGFMYAQGRGVRQDNVEAMKWLWKGAEQGNADAQQNLLHMYEKGDGVAWKFVSIYTWAELANGQSRHTAAGAH